MTSRLPELDEVPLKLIHHIRQHGGSVERIGDEVKVTPPWIVTPDIRRLIKQEEEGMVLALVMEQWGQMWCLMDADQFFRRH